MARRRNSSNLEAVLQELGKDVKNAAIQALSEGADLVAGDADRRAPVREGRLKASIHKIPQNNGRRIKIVADAKSDKGFPYGLIVEFRPKGRRPFLYPALDAQRTKVREMIADAIREAIKKNAQRR